jgi:hypothetical protein
VNIDIDQGRFHLKEEVDDGVKSVGEATKTIADGSRDELIIDGAVIEEEKLPLFIAPGFAQGKQIARNRYPCPYGFGDRNELLRRGAISE